MSNVRKSRITSYNVCYTKLLRFKEQGATRYIGVTVATSELYEPLSRFLDKEQPDFSYNFV